jgi:hypothetical protein
MIGAQDAPIRYRRSLHDRIGTLYPGHTEDEQSQLQPARSNPAEGLNAPATSQGSIHVVLADGANARRLRPLITNRLRKPHFLPHFQVIELATFDAVAMKIDLSTVRRSNEPVISLRMKRGNRSVWRGLVRFDVSLTPTNEILKLATRRIERIVQRHVYILVATGGRRIAADRDIGAVRNGQMQPHAVGVALVMAMLWLSDHDTRRGDAVIELLKLACSLSRMSLDCIGMVDMLECDLKWDLHLVGSTFSNQTRVTSKACRSAADMSLI